MASSVAQPLERQLAQIPGIAQMTSTSSLGSTAVTIQFDLNRQHRRRGQRRSGGDQRCQRPIAEEPAVAADLSQGQSGRLADPSIVGDLGHRAADQSERRSRRATRAADQPDFRRRPGVHRRPAEARDSRADRSREAGGQGARRWKMSAARSRSRRSTVRRATSMARGVHSRFTPTISCWMPRTGTTSS